MPQALLPSFCCVEPLGATNPCDAGDAGDGY